MLQSFRDSPR
uniref:Orf n=1 Tax=Escherichia coli O157:H7 TaxID=83334 RepID=Q93UU2_ECO57|nr:orf [Escherichia coli O157:H7]